MRKKEQIKLYLRLRVDLENRIWSITGQGVRHAGSQGPMAVSLELISLFIQCRLQHLAAPTLLSKAGISETLDMLSASKVILHNTWKSHEVNSLTIWQITGI